MENRFTLHFATINTFFMKSSIHLVAIFTLHFATINTSDKNVK